ncbi:MAG: right-handed parallel beta-helix repeat-containing protein [Clostridiales Family XIII bacterium]|nr:right-handed parallel beta-helix repeat-containing protein [Clostridiales Family XIII bacterium]
MANQRNAFMRRFLAPILAVALAFGLGGLAVYADDGYGDPVGTDSENGGIIENTDAEQAGEPTLTVAVVPDEAIAQASEAIENSDGAAVQCVLLADIPEVYVELDENQNIKTGGAFGDTSVDSAAADLQSVIDRYADSGAIIHVGAGTFFRQATDRSAASFVMKKNVSLIGGEQGESILSGEFQQDGDNTNNAYHVVVAVGDLGTASLKGFTITGGYADGEESYYNGKSVYDDSGAGIYLRKTGVSVSDLVIVNNVATYGGGGIYIDGELKGHVVTIEKSTVQNNTVLSDQNSGIAAGGGIYVDRAPVSLSEVTIADNTVTNNGPTAPQHFYGGGIYFSGKTDGTVYKSIMNRCTITGNSVTNTRVKKGVADGMGEGGGIALDNFNGLTVSNSLIAENQAPTNGGGFFSNVCSPAFNNCTFANNRAGAIGGQEVYLQGKSEVAYFFNSIIYNDSENPAVAGYGNGKSLCGDHNLIFGGFSNCEDGTDGTIYKDPKLDENYHLTKDSPCLDAHDNSDAGYDLAGNVRRTGIGAYEYTAPAVDDDTEDVIGGGDETGSTGGTNGNANAGRQVGTTGGTAGQSAANANAAATSAQGTAYATTVNANTATDKTSDSKEVKADKPAHTNEAVDTAVQAAGETAKAHWAFLNLVLAAFGIACWLIALFITLGQKNRKFAGVIISCVFTLAGLALFLFTQDMTLPTVVADKYTVFHVIGLLGAAAGMLLTFRHRDTEEA